MEGGSSGTEVPASNGSQEALTNGAAHQSSDPLRSPGTALDVGSISTAIPGLEVTTAAETSNGFVWLETVDGEVETVEREVALLSPLIHREVLRNGHGASEESPVLLPKQVSPGVLKLILEYCRFHRMPGRSDKERKLFDEKFIRLDTRRLCELTSAADSLDMKPLVDLTSRALARMIEGKTPEEIRETFHLPDDLTEEEKLEPVKNANDDPRIRLLNRLYAKKRKLLREKQLLKEKLQIRAILGGEDKTEDDRSVDDLLQFIGIESKEEGKKSAKKKGKKKKKKDAEPTKTGQAELALQKGKEKGKGAIVTESSHTPERAKKHFESHLQSVRKGGSEEGPQGARSHSPAFEEDDLHEESIFDEAEFDDDDDLDPAEKEKLDREVEDFARRLNSDWQDRMQEILALASTSADYENVAQAISKSCDPALDRSNSERERDLLQRLQELQRQSLEGHLGGDLTTQPLLSPSGSNHRTLRPEYQTERHQGPSHQAQGPNHQAQGADHQERAWKGMQPLVEAVTEVAAAAPWQEPQRVQTLDPSVYFAGLSLGSPSTLPPHNETVLGQVSPHKTTFRKASPSLAPTSHWGEVPTGQASSGPLLEQNSLLDKLFPRVPDPVEVPRVDVGRHSAPFGRLQSPRKLGAMEDSKEIGGLLQAFLKRVGKGDEVALVDQDGFPVSEVESHRVLEQWDARGRGMSMCLQLGSGAVLSIALTSPPDLAETSAPLERNYGNAPTDAVPMMSRPLL